MLPLFILIPLLTAILLLFVKNNKMANNIALATTLVILGLSILVAVKGAVDYNQPWILILNTRFLLHTDGLAKILILLTGISFPAILFATTQNQPKQKNIFLFVYFFYSVITKFNSV